MRSSIVILTLKPLKKILASCRNEEEIKSALINHYGLPREIKEIGGCGFCALWSDGTQALVENMTVKLKSWPSYRIKIEGQNCLK